MTTALRGPIAGVAIAIAINAAMDAAGLSELSFASLFPLVLAFWFVQRLPRRRMGLTLGHWRDYGLAIAHPAVVLAALLLVCQIAGAIGAHAVDWPPARTEFLSAFALSVPLALLTEEGFFRGWLFASLQRAGLSEARVVLWTSLAFSLWHIPAVTMHTADALPWPQVPVLLANAVVIGTIWGMLRSISGSIVVTSVCHALWNASVYVLFGFGATVGALDIKQPAIYGPESGYWGLGLNLALAIALWHWWKRRNGNGHAVVSIPETASQ